MKKITIAVLICLPSLTSLFNGAGNCFGQYTKLHDFLVVPDGSIPNGSFISDGSFLYGMTYHGGTNDYGTIFKMKPDGTVLTKLLDFAGTSNGIEPIGSLISDGTFLYGTTSYGGTNNLGTIFKIKPDGTGYAMLLDFAGVTNGSHPWASLIFDGTYLYGMTAWGGTNNLGTIFKLKPDGTGYVMLLDLDGAANGSHPWGSLISDGTFLYGTTGGGGTYGLGTIFKIKSDGTGYAKLLDFAGAANGAVPYGSLVSDGTFLYGMTPQGGTNNLGTIFKLKPDGTGYATLLDFAGSTNGSIPRGSLIFDGIFLYGMTDSGGTNNLGTVFKIKADGTGYALLEDFEGATNGSNPFGSLFSDGTFLYGMTQSGGSSNLGVIFRYSLPSTITGVIEGTATSLMDVYPNPGSDNVTLSLGGFEKDKVVSIFIIDPQGRVMERTTGLGQHELSIDVRNYALGKYIARAQQNKTKVSRSFIKTDR